MGGKAEKTNLEITHTILNLMGTDESVIEYMEDRKGHDQRYAIDFSKIKNELAWKPQVSFEEGMKKTVEWYQNNPEWWKKLREKYNF